MHYQKSQKRLSPFFSRGTARFTVRFAVALLPICGGLLMAPRVLAQAPQVQVQDAANHVVNGGFENGLNGWNFSISGSAKVTGAVTADDKNSGQNSLRVTNESAYGPNVYGSLVQEVKGLKPDTEYEISVWVKGRDASGNWIGGGPGWAVREQFPGGTYDWRHITRNFKTGPDQTLWDFVFLTEGPTAELLLDDIELVEASQAQRLRIFPASLSSGGAASTRRTKLTLDAGSFAPDSYESEEQISGTFHDTTNAARAAQQLIFSLKKPDGSIAELGRAALPAAPAGVTREVKFAMSAALLPEGDYQLLAALDAPNAKTVATAPLVRRNLEGQIAALQSQMTTRLAQIKKNASTRGVENNAYVRLGLSIAERYIERVAAKGPDGKQTNAWSWLQISEVQRVLADTQKLIAAPLPLSFDGVRGPVNIRDGVFTQSRNGIETPLFLGGYGHFGQALKDVPNFTKFGASIIQQERGPNTLNADGSENGGINGGVTGILDTLKKADAAGIKVDLLLSPHYFPQWAIDQAPDVITNNGNFIKMNVDHPKAREVIEKWLRAIVPAVKNEPALFSLNLSNEPFYTKSGTDPYSRPLFIAYLREKHQDIAALNALYGTNYARFEDVPVPDTNVPGFERPDGEKRAFFDWAMFNQQHFADWHRWMNGIVKSLAPDVKTQAKIMSFYYMGRGQLNHGIDPEQISEVTDLAGNDNVALPLTTYEAPEVVSMKYAYNWQTQQMSYDLQRSFKNQPVFNGENHIIPDRYQKPVPPEHTRSVMWQGALHGMGGTTTWVWEESLDPSNDVEGNIYYRPANVFGAGRAWLDLARLNREAAAVVRAKPRIAILYSKPSLFWSQEYPDAMRAAYSALNFLGEPISFVTEKQLRENRASFDAIVLPRATHVEDATVAALSGFVARGGKLIRFGDGNLERDEYSRARTLPANLRGAALPYTNSDLVMWQQMQPALVSLKPRALLNAQSGKQTFGIEYRFVQDGARRLLSLNNLQRAPQNVRIAGAAANARVLDLLSGEKLDAARIPMLSMQPRFLLLNP